MHVEIDNFGSEDLSLSVSRITWQGDLTLGVAMVEILTGRQFALACTSSDCGLENLTDS